MRWFASFWITTLLAGIAAGLFALRAAEVPVVSDALRWLIPVGGVPWLAQVGLVFGCWALMRAALRWVLAYTASATDASPRAGPGKRARLGALAYVAFGNPSGRWLGFFAAALGVVAVLAAPVRAVAGLPPLAWALTALYAATLAMAAVNPDRPQPLRAAPDPDPDPLLAVPGMPQPHP